MRACGPRRVDPQGLAQQFAPPRFRDWALLVVSLLFTSGGVFVLPFEREARLRVLRQLSSNPS
jgi:hypothetical protein